MALRFASTALDFSRRRRRWLLLAAAVGVSGFGAYRLYHLPSVSRTRSQLARIFEALASAAEVVELVSDDLNRFLRSDTDEIPTSLKQLAKITRSDEFVGSVSRVSEAFTAGIIRGFDAYGGKTGSTSFSDRFFEKLFSEEGTGLASVTVGSFAKNLVIAFYSGGSGSESEAIPVWFRLLSDSNSKELIADCIQRFVSTAVTVYLEKTMVINTYDQIFSGLTNSKHEEKVKDILVSVCNGAVATLVRTSHQVMNDSGSLTSSSNGAGGVEQEGERAGQIRGRQRNCANTIKSMHDAGWVEQVSSTLAVPSNRELVLDVTGRVTFETVKSFLDFLSSKLSDSAKRGARAVHTEVMERGLEVVRYVSAKSMTVFTICLALCMRLCVGTRILTPS